jgi:hypothetical protein
MEKYLLLHLFISSVFHKRFYLLIEEKKMVSFSFQLLGQILCNELFQWQDFVGGSENLREIYNVSGVKEILLNLVFTNIMYKERILKNIFSR